MITHFTVQNLPLLCFAAAALLTCVDLACRSVRALLHALRARRRARRLPREAAVLHAALLSASPGAAVFAGRRQNVPPTMRFRVGRGSYASADAARLYETIQKGMMVAPVAKRSAPPQGRKR